MQELEKEGAKAISLQAEEHKLYNWQDSSGVMGEWLVLADRLISMNGINVVVVGEQRLELQPHALEDPKVVELMEVMT